LLGENAFDSKKTELEKRARQRKLFEKEEKERVIEKASKYGRIH